MTSLESQTLVEIERVKGKAAIAVAVIENIASGGIASINETKIEKLYEIIEKAQATLDWKMNTKDLLREVF